MSFRPPKKPALTLDASIVQDDQPLEVIQNVFVGSIHAAFNLDALQMNGVTHILNASRLPVTFPRQFTYLSVEIRDKGESNILSCIPTTNIFIEAGIDAGGVLVHCFGGKSRSVAMIAAFLMSSYNWSFDQAYSIVKRARPVAEMNSGFECQLRAYGLANYDVYVAQQILLRSRIRELHIVRAKLAPSMSPLKPSEPSSSDGQSNRESPTCIVEVHGPLSSDPSDAADERINQISDSSEISPTNRTYKSSGQKKRSRGDGKKGGAKGVDNGSMDIDDDDEEVEEDATDIDETRVIETITERLSEDRNDGGSLEIDELKSVVTLSSRSVDAMGNINMPGSGNGLSARHVMAANAASSSAAVAGIADMTITIGRSVSGSRSGSQTTTNRSRRSQINRGSRRSSTEVETKTPSCRLSRPGSSAVRVIPPLRGLEQEFKCSWCSTALFSLANVVRVDMVTDILKLLDTYQADEKNASSAAASHKKSAIIDNYVSTTRHVSIDTDGAALDGGAVDGGGKRSPSLVPDRGACSFDAEAAEHFAPDFTVHREKFSPVAGSFTGNGTGSQQAQQKGSSSLQLSKVTGAAEDVYEQGVPFKPQPNRIAAAFDAAGAVSEVSSGNSGSGHSSFPQLSSPQLDTASARCGSKKKSEFSIPPINSPPVTASSLDALHSGPKGSTAPQEGTLFPPIRSARSSLGNDDGFSAPLSARGRAAAASPGAAALEPPNSMSPVEMDVDSAETSTSNFSISSSSFAPTSSAAMVGGKQSSRSLRAGAGAGAVGMANPTSAEADFKFTFPPPSTRGGGKSFKFDSPTFDIGGSDGGAASPAAARTGFGAIGFGQERVLSPAAALQGKASVGIDLGESSAAVGRMQHSAQSKSMGDFSAAMADMSTSPSAQGRNGGGLPLSPHSSYAVASSASTSRLPNIGEQSVYPGSPTSAFNLCSYDLHNLKQGQRTRERMEESDSPRGVPIISPRSKPIPANPTLYSPLYGAGGYGINFSGYDHSPRVTVPPHRMHDGSGRGMGSSGSSTPGSGSYSWSPRVDRPQSAEKRRWLARVHLLRGDADSSSPVGGERGAGSVAGAGSRHRSAAAAGGSRSEEAGTGSEGGEGKECKVAKMAEDDDIASKLAFGREKYLHVEYMEWMGKDIFRPENDMGDICCKGCKRVLGSWCWKPSIRLLLDGKLEAPLFRIAKNVVQLTDLPFDATPSSTPRPSEDVLAESNRG